MQSKEKHSRRIQQKESYAKRQAKIAKAHHFPAPKSTKHCETSATTCGSSNCVMCGNPRKFWKELTIQERRLFQDP